MATRKPCLKVRHPPQRSTHVSGYIFIYDYGKALEFTSFIAESGPEADPPPGAAKGKGKRKAKKRAQDGNNPEDNFQAGRLAWYQGAGRALKKWNVNAIVDSVIASHGRLPIQIMASTKSLVVTLISCFKSSLTDSAQRRSQTCLSSHKAYRCPSSLSEYLAGEASKTPMACIFGPALTFSSPQSWPTAGVG